MGKYGECAEVKGKRVDKTIFAAETDDGKDAWYIIAKSRKTGLTLLVFRRTSAASMPLSRLWTED